jgi:aminoglycoside phosphotransferase (APT) family kinase protein
MAGILPGGYDRNTVRQDERMRAISLPDVPYGATAVRPGWLDLPESLREAITARLGGPIVAARSAGGGFTRAFAAVLETAAGTSVFVKAAPLTEPTSEWYAREASITAALPPAVAAPRPRWTMTHSGYFALALDAVDGEVPTLPWAPEHLDATVSAWLTAASALAVPPLPGLPALADIARAEMSEWSTIAGGYAPIPRSVPADRLPALAALEQRLPEAVAGPGMLHGDLRIDNVLIDRSGRAWLCDWTWPCLGAPWFDTVTLLVTAYASGAEVDRFLADAPAGGVDAALAALAGYWLTRAEGPASTASPHSRQHHRYSGRAAMSWLAARQGWDDLR